jgi:hypothetical protein
MATRVGGSGTKTKNALDYVKIFLWNLLLIPAVYFALADLASRLQYFRAVGFSPEVAYSLFTYSLPISKASVSYPGIPTMDWSQVLLVVLVLIDGNFVIEMFLRRRKPAVVPNSVSTEVPRYDQV